MLSIFEAFSTSLANLAKGKRSIVVRRTLLKPLFVRYPVVSKKGLSKGWLFNRKQKVM